MLFVHRLLCKNQDFRKVCHGWFSRVGHVCLPDFQIQLLNLSSTLMLRGLKVCVSGILLVCFGSGFKISSTPRCFKTVWRCGIFLGYVVEDLALSNWPSKIGSSHLPSARHLWSCVFIFKHWFNWNWKPVYFY